jgi:general secretion pathway protein G
METTENVPPLPGEKPIWKRGWFWLIAAGAAGCLGFLVLGVLATLVVPNVLVKFHLASRKKAEADIVAIKNALTEYAVVNGGKFPDSLQGLVTPDIHGRTYLDTPSVPKDPWGRAYLYEPPGPGNPHPRVLSYGKDGQPGGEGDDADLDGGSLSTPH